MGSLFRKSNSSTKNSLLILTLFVLFSLTSAIQTTGHSPTSLTIEYDTNTSELSATFTHSISGTEHYIETVEIRKNSVLNQTHNYVSQSHSVFTYLYTINCSVGDILSVKGYCNEGGSITRSITVTENTFTNTSTTNSVPVSHLCVTVLVLLGSIAIRRKK